MKLGDGPTTSAEVHIDAPPDVVWLLVADPDVPARFSSELVAARWDESGPGPGGRIIGTNRHDAVGEWETTSFVSSWEPPRCLEWRVSDYDNPGAQWRFDLEARGDGTQLTQTVTLGPGPSGITAVIASMPEHEERIIERRLAEHRANIEATLAGIKSLAEKAG